MLSNRFKLMSALMLTAGVCSPVLAEEATMAEPDWSFVSSATLASDNIFRGQSQTWGKPAVLLGVEVDHKSGLYAGLAAANVSDHWLPGAHVEIDYYGGYRDKLPGAASVVAYDVGMIYYTYPGGANWDQSDFPSKSNSLNTLEAYVALTYDWLTFKTGRAMTEYWGWSTNNSPVNGGFAGDLGAGVTGNTRGSYYYELDANYALNDSWSLIGQAGRQVIHNATGLDINYYKAGVNKAFDAGWSVQAAYSWTSEPDAYKDFVSLRNGLRGNPSDSDVAKDVFLVSITKAF
ncbi:MAG: TorF family putative porin [Methylophilaceae bacterium]